LSGQVERMLDDPKSESFVEHFLDHWLLLKDIELTQPDDNLYPDYNPLLLESMLAETRAFFHEMIAADLGVTHVVDSDFTYANQRLAELYRLPQILGTQLRRVPLTHDSRRGGILTQASVLKVTANGTTTSPVERGVFVMTQLLGDPPPPPPPTVPAVEPDISGATTIRQQLAMHREDPSCASCHTKIDPPGFALESFDVMGGYRTRYRSVEIGDEIPDLLIHGGRRSGVRESLVVDSSGQMPDGTTFADIDAFRQWLVSTQRSQLGDNLLRQFIIYATGRPVGFADQQEFDRLLQSLESSDFGIRSMIHVVVQSQLFLNK
jgi:hypothetical protein